MKINLSFNIKMDFQGIRHLPLKDIRLKTARTDSFPELTEDAVRDIKNIAKFLGINYIPTATVNRMQEDPDFCLALLSPHIERRSAKQMIERDKEFLTECYKNDNKEGISFYLDGFKKIEEEITVCDNGVRQAIISPPTHGTLFQSVTAKRLLTNEAISLEPWAEKEPPKYDNNLLRNVFLFARWKGLRQIPAAVVKRMKEDVAFIYVLQNAFYNLGDSMQQEIAINRTLNFLQGEEPQYHYTDFARRGYPFPRMFTDNFSLPGGHEAVMKLRGQFRRDLKKILQNAPINYEEFLLFTDGRRESFPRDKRYRKSHSFTLYMLEILSVDYKLPLRPFGNCGHSFVDHLDGGKPRYI